ncbi:DxFTY motif-containing membrane protein [Spiroplasma endosymbiont of Labia minor]|uniref:DxFTY motif-containing membrane protein n=1 Tax=Spiroplasma endosymbiont of Labia minor TaxID=3066305 RepID=UPI0030D41ED3
MSQIKYDKATEDVTNRINFIKEFNAERTPFWISVLWIMIESFIPGLIIFLLLGNDFPSISYLTTLPTPNSGYLTLICTGYLFYSFLTTLVIFYCKGHREDNFTFSLAFTLTFISVILNSLWLGHKSWMIILRFVLAIVVLIIATIIGMFFTMIFRNNMLKIREENEIMLIAYRNGEIIPERKIVRVKRYEVYKQKMLQKKHELEAFKAELYSDKEIVNDNLKINNELSKKDMKHRKKMLKKEIKINEKAKKQNQEFM